jgi:hypothetical protein
MECNSLLVGGAPVQEWPWSAIPGLEEEQDLLTPPQEKTEGAALAEGDIVDPAGALMGFPGPMPGVDDDRGQDAAQHRPSSLVSNCTLHTQQSEGGVLVCRCHSCTTAQLQVIQHHGIWLTTCHRASQDAVGLNSWHHSPDTAALKLYLATPCTQRRSLTVTWHIQPVT